MPCKIFAFVIGSDKDDFAIKHLHLADVARLSHRALLISGTQEAQEGRVEWPDIDAHHLMPLHAMGRYGSIWKGLR